LIRISMMGIPMYLRLRIVRSFYFDDLMQQNVYEVRAKLC
jgi:hypothetical protein